VARTDGTAARVTHNIVLRTPSLDPAVLARRDPEADAVARLDVARRGGRLDALYAAAAGRGDDGLRREAGGLFGALPELSPGTVSAGRLVQLGLWPADAGHASSALLALAATSPRYFPGRRVLVAGGLGTLLGFDGADPPDARSTAHVQPQDARSTARVALDGGGEVSVPLADLAARNQRHVLPAVGGELKLEDGLRCNCERLVLMRATRPARHAHVAPSRARAGLSRTPRTRVHVHVHVHVRDPVVCVTAPLRKCASLPDYHQPAAASCSVRHASSSARRA